MMITPLRALPALAVMLAGCFAADAWRRRVRARQAKEEMAHHMQTWEGEGGSLSPAAAEHANDESSLATSAP
ncbi:MAG TPA: hypothetical protein VGN52_17155 [Burkholderiales bacterium]